MKKRTEKQQSLGILIFCLMALLTMGAIMVGGYFLIGNWKIFLGVILLLWSNNLGQRYVVRLREMEAKLESDNLMNKVMGK